MHLCRMIKFFNKQFKQQEKKKNQVNFKKTKKKEKIIAVWEKFNRMKILGKDA